MTNKISFYRIFFLALRTSLVFISAAVTYELLKKLEIKWNKMNPNKNVNHLVQRHIYHFGMIFIADFLILTLFVLLFDVHI